MRRNKSSFLLFLSLFVFLHSEPCFGAQRKSPVDIAVAFDNPQPTMHSAQLLTVRLTSSRDIAGASLILTLPDEVVQVEGDSSWAGDLFAGEAFVLPMTVTIIEEGSFSVGINLNCDVSRPSGCDRKVNFNIIASQDEVLSGMVPFIRMRYDRARTWEEQMAVVGIKGIEVATPMDVPIHAPELPDFLQPIDRPGTSDSAAEDSGHQGTDAVIQVNVSGRITYKDSAGAEHPVRYAKVQVHDIDGGFETIMGQGFTSANGTYSIMASGGDTSTGPDIQVVVWAWLTNSVIARIGPDENHIYRLESSVHNDYTSPTLQVSMTTQTPVPGSATDDDNARIFSVLDALLQVALEAYCLRGRTLMPEITVLWPAAGSFYNGLINIRRSDSLDWDVIFHEYGHYLGRVGGATNFHTPAGGAHDGGSTIPDHGKEKGVRMAWNEGWATFFAIAAQVEPSCTEFGIKLPAVPNAGDISYHDTENTNIVDNLETTGDGPITGLSEGYASELSIMAALFDLTDPWSDSSSDGDAKDSINVKPAMIWDLVNSADLSDVGKFYNFLMGSYMDKRAIQFVISQIFSMNNIGPELTLPADGVATSRSVPPTFEWEANGDPTPGYELNRFILAISKDNFSTFQLVKKDINTNSQTLSKAEWEKVMKDGDDLTEFQWTVLGSNPLDPHMPFGGGFRNFMAGPPRTFTISYWDAPIPDTGQSRCYNNTAEIQCPAPDKAFFGQDAYYSRKPMSYTDNMDGTVTDNVTNLVWQMQDDNNTYTHTEAITYCNDLSLAGHGDWRLPTKKELLRIVHFGRTAPTIDTFYFPGTESDFYWTSSEFPDVTGYAWVVDFNWGSFWLKIKNDPVMQWSVRCVRGNSTSNGTFVDNGNGTVSDNDTGLMWDKDTPASIWTWQQALGYCEGSSVGGYTDWRLPNIKELESITSLTDRMPAIDTTFFPDTQNGYIYWSSTTADHDASRVKGIMIRDGDTYIPGKTEHFAFRCVRDQ